MWSSSFLSFTVVFLFSIFAIKVHGGCWQKLCEVRSWKGTAIDSVEESLSNISWRHYWWMRISRCGASCSKSEQSSIGSQKRDYQVPKLFQDKNDEVYDLYAACLAATEGLRRIRDQTIQSQQDPASSQSTEKFRSKKSIREGKELAIASYVENASKVIESMGMPVSEFNAIGRKVCKDSVLKEKVRRIVLC
jgi:Domain of unknown function (DUF4168)